MTAVFANSTTTAIWLLRLGLAAVLLYAAFASLATPEDWLGYLPNAATTIIDGALLLKMLALYQIALALWLLSGVYLHLAGLVCAATLGAILVTNLSLLTITFRDAGLLFAALALTALSWPAKKK